MKISKSSHLIISFLVIISLFIISPIFANQAQPVPIPEDPSTTPQIEIEGVGIGSIEYGKTPEHKKGEGGINFSDSALFLGASQRLYRGGIGSFGIGGLSLEKTNKGTETGLFLHKAFLDYQTASFEALIGRSDNPSAHLVDFPTLRGDDLIALTNPLNQFSNGENAEEHRYSNLGQIVFNQNLTYFENIHVQHLIDSANLKTQTGINSFGATFEYLAPPGLEAFSLFPSWGVGFEHVLVPDQSPSGIHIIYGGGIINLNESVTNRVSFMAQNVLSIGSDLKEFKSVTDTYQADSNTITAAIRYLHAPFGMSGYQLALTGGAKNYSKVSHARSYGWALTGVKRLGQGFDLVAQYQGQWRDRALARVQSSDLAYQQVFEVGFVFNFNATFNPHISPRRSLLNQKHQYIPN